jgi:hypothetical protein
MKRYGQIVGIKPEILENHKKYHAVVRPVWRLAGEHRRGGPT